LFLIFFCCRCQGECQGKKQTSVVNFKVNVNELRGGWRFVLLIFVAGLFLHTYEAEFLQGLSWSDIPALVVPIMISLMCRLNLISTLLLQHEHRRKGY
jgi:hypothetical protein